jgi:putative FmdB family regulatory protein
MEELQSISEPPLVRCPSCSGETLARVIGTGTGLIFKGTGFYLTDYKKEAGGQSKKEPKKPETKEAPPPSPPSTEKPDAAKKKE